MVRSATTSTKRTIPMDNNSTHEISGSGDGPDVTPQTGIDR